MPDFTSVLGLANELGLVDQLRTSLTRQNDPAAEKLVEVLDQLYKMVCALDEEIVRYLSLYFGSEESVIAGRSVLLGMEVGQSRIRINEARGHCHKIANIYEKFLRRWLQDVLNPFEADQLKGLFERLGTADSRMIQAMEDVTSWLTQEASSALDLVEQKYLDAANQQIRKARLEVKPAREQLTEAMSRLRGLQAQLIAQAGAV